MSFTLYGNNRCRGVRAFSVLVKNSLCGGRPSPTRIVCRMIIPRLIPLSLLAILPAVADITFSNSTFNVSDWTAGRLQAGSVTSFQARQSFDGGNPGPLRRPRKYRAPRLTLPLPRAQSA